MTIVKHLKDDQMRQLTDFKVGNTVKVHQRIKEGGKERIQIFEGVVIARKGGTGLNATFMVRKIASGVGVERIYPLHSQTLPRSKFRKMTLFAKPRFITSANAAITHRARAANWLSQRNRKKQPRKLPQPKPQKLNN
jgi:large subunit ribosomal protein L19